jgi:hypothetical protein
MKEKGVRTLFPVAATAMRLLGNWRRISQGHVALATGCSCGVGVSNLRVQDFEQDILDFLRGKHGEACSRATIADLLTDIARTDDAKASALLKDLEGSLDSFEQQHSGR